MKRLPSLPVRVSCLLLLAVMLSAAGCASGPKEYVYGTPYRSGGPGPLFDASLPQVERGRSVWVIDKLGHCVFSLPRKLILWDTRVGNHSITEEQEELIRRFLAENDMRNVKVRINQYAPIGELKRLWRNSEVNPFYRATFGLFNWLWYTLVPGRVFAGSTLTGDDYNPYTNTIHIYSGHSTIVVHEGSHAKDFSRRKYKGTWAVAGLVPFVDLYQESIAKNDALSYFYSLAKTNDEAEAFRMLQANHGSYFGRNIAKFVGPLAPAAQAVATVIFVIPGHFVGRSQSRALLAAEEPPPPRKAAPSKTAKDKTKPKPKAGK